MSKSKPTLGDALRSARLNGPTKEQLQHGYFIRFQVEKNGAKVAFNTAATPFHHAYSLGKLTERQFEAAKWFENRSMLLSEGGGSRDSLDFTIRGTANSNINPTDYYLDQKALMQKVEARLRFETQKEYEVRIRAMRKKVKGILPYLKLGKFGGARLKIVRGVCVEHSPIGKMATMRKRYMLLCEGLDIVADVVL